MKTTLTIIAIALFTGCDPVTHGVVERIEKGSDKTVCVVLFYDSKGSGKSHEWIECPDSTVVGSKVNFKFN